MLHVIKSLRYAFNKRFSIHTPITDDVLHTIAYTPTKDLKYVAEDNFFKKLTDENCMRIARLLAEKSYNEDGCPIGGLIRCNKTGRILGKGHNTLKQEGDPYNHGETAAIRDAGRQDFSNTTIFTTLSPCDVCATLLYMRQFERVVVGDVTNASGNEEALRARGVQVEILEDPKTIALYAQYRREKPEQDLEDWLGVAGAKNPDACYPTGIGFPPKK